MSSNLKRLATIEDAIIEVEIPITSEELNNRVKDYPQLSDKQFATKYRRGRYNSVVAKALLTFFGRRRKFSWICRNCF
ncbi:hypothetical protein [Priestia koreensis]|uniref:hypothetical protein n=1 Tax=Priestia koreensis TaxID=284581 RepID=UPI00301A1D6D